MTGQEVRKLSDEEVVVELKRLREKLFTLKNQATTEKVENTAQFPLLRADIARLLGEQSARRHKASPRKVKAPAVAAPAAAPGKKPAVKKTAAAPKAPAVKKAPAKKKAAAK